MAVNKKQKENYRFLFQDLIWITASIGLALFIVWSQILEHALAATQQFELLGSFIAGLFFTSIFTTALATVTLGEISQMNSLFATAFFGALGAVVGDLIIFRFVHDRFSEHLLSLVREQGLLRRIKALVHLKIFRWFVLLIGGLIIASPLPDELGISILGLSKMNPRWFAVLSFTCNFLGILTIGLIARAL